MTNIYNELQCYSNGFQTIYILLTMCIYIWPQLYVYNGSAFASFANRYVPRPSANSFQPVLLCLRIFLCIFTKSKNIADVIWKSEQTILVNKVKIASLCLVDAKVNPNWTQNCYDWCLHYNDFVHITTLGPPMQYLEWFR